MLRKERISLILILCISSLMFEGCGSSLSSIFSNTSSDSICDVGAVGIYRSNICPAENFEKYMIFARKM